MNDNFFKSKKKMTAIIIFVILILSVIYFFNLLTPDKMIYGSDWVLTVYPRMETTFEHIKTHFRLPMWDIYNFSGHPTIETSGGGGIVYPLNLLYMIFPVHLGRVLLFMLHTFLAGLGMWLLLREYKISNLSSMIGAIAYMFSGQMITTTHGGHLGRMVGGVLLPFAFLFLHRALLSGKTKDFIKFGGVTGLLLLGGHPQIGYWSMIAITFYFIFFIIKDRNELKKSGILKNGSLFIVGIVIVLLIASIKLLPPVLSIEYGARGITRGYDYSASWSMPTSELFNLAVPHFSGILNSYWGENYFKLDSRYMGILPLMLFGFGIFYRKKRAVLKYFLWFTGITLLMALGKNTPLFRIYYFIVPFAKKFRAPSMFFFLTTFGISVMSGFGAQRILNIAGNKNKENKIPKELIFLYVFLGLIILSAIIITAGDKNILRMMSNHFMKSWTGIIGREQLRSKLILLNRNFSTFNKGLWITVLFTIINGGMVFALIKNKISYKIILPLLSLVLLIDVWRIDKKYLSSVEPPEKYYSSDQPTELIKRDNGNFRVFPLSYQKGRGGYFQYHKIQSVAGYGANPPRRYQEFIGAGKGVIFRSPNFFRFPHLLSMLNTKYIITPVLPKDLTNLSGNQKETVRFLKQFYTNFSEKREWNNYKILYNDNNRPRAELIYEYSVRKNKELILNSILDNDFKPGSTVVLEKSPSTVLKGKGKNQIKTTEYQANIKEYEVNTEKPGFLLVRENYHPHWKCFIDGQRSKIYRANYIFYGTFIPEGEHNVKFEYISKKFYTSAWMSFAGFVIFLIFLIIPTGKKTES